MNDCHYCGSRAEGDQLVCDACDTRRHAEWVRDAYDYFDGIGADFTDENNIPGAAGQ